MDNGKERAKAAWILDFILRQQMDESVKNGICDYLPDGADNPHLKKTMLLHRVSSHLANHSISEKTLECLESIAKLDRKAGWEVPESLKEAYCAVAAECTSNNTMPMRESDDEIDDMVAQGEALVESLNKYLIEALSAMSPPPLELVIRSMIREGKVSKDGSGPVGPVHASDTPDGSTRARALDVPWQWLMNEALKLGPAEVQTTVEDPLTDEVAMSFGVPSSMGHEAMDSTPLEPSQDMNVPCPSVNPSACNFEVDDAPIEAPSMEPPSSSKNARLYNLRESASSPCQVNKSTEVATRRKIKRWSTLEEDTLRQALERDGRNWKFILGLHPKIFENRTEVDLKDKWRNMMKH